MSALTGPRNTQTMGAGGVPVKTFYPVLTGVTIYEGSIVVIDSSGYAKPGVTGTGLVCVGIALGTVVNSGASGSVSVEIQQGVSCVGNGSTITKSSVGALCYVVDDQTVSTTASGKSIAGTIYLVETSGVWVYMGLIGPIDASALTTFETSLAANTAANGASLVGVQDADSNFTASSTVESALQQAMETTRSVISCPIPAYSAVANAGVLMRLTPGFKGRILGMHVQATTAVTTGSKLATLTPNIAASPVTGGVVSMTSAGQNAIGAVQNGTTVTAANTFTAVQEITVVASSVTAFIEGAGVIYLVLG